MAGFDRLAGLWQLFNYGIWSLRTIAISPLFDLQTELSKLLSIPEQALSIVSSSNNGIRMVFIWTAVNLLKAESVVYRVTA